jgi:hypothetical protein
MKRGGRADARENHGALLPIPLETPGVRLLASRLHIGLTTEMGGCLSFTAASLDVLRAEGPSSTHRIAVHAHPAAHDECDVHCQCRPCRWGTPTQAKLSRDTAKRISRRPLLASAAAQ